MGPVTEAVGFASLQHPPTQMSHPIQPFATISFVSLGHPRWYNPTSYVLRVNVEKPKGLLRQGDFVSFRVDRSKGKLQAVGVRRLREDGTEDDTGTDKAGQYVCVSCVCRVCVMCVCRVCVVCV